MGEMIERVARAMKVADDMCATPDEAIRPKFHHWRAYVPLANAAIEAMREPTQKMIDACDINIPTEGEISGIWSDMIDEALK